MNAKVGSENTNVEEIMGKHGCGIRNENGEQLVDFCLSNNLVIGGTIFPHLDIHKLTWKSPDGRTTNQIDHFMINRKWRRSLQDVRVIRGADANSDHYLLRAIVQLKLRKAPRQANNRRKLDIPRLNSPTVRKAFNLELKNRFNVLENEDTIEEHWNNIKSIYNETAEKIIGFQTKKNKEWLSEETWKKIEERKGIKQKILHTKSARLQDQLQMNYKTKDREVKRSARKVKRKYTDDLAEEAERAATHGELSTVYKITKQLCGNKTSKTRQVKDKQGNSLMRRKNKQRDG
ncbi:uncharacterized protein LOC125656441 [Ostrea edulis]|uniref:uncharacterized protein LOC125656441 n=1 Tax=Ostrea edulis TaxID=37623 RepID=UPI0024AFA5C0|nr:uncharacterized protein LOC125656441 [Ostrea edulis]